MTTTSAIAPQTRTETVLTAEHHAAAAMFLSRPDMTPAFTEVEEDSTDVYVSEKCSPLNDF